MAVRYDRATDCSGGPTPGAIALRDHWRRVTGLRDMGIYNCRSVRGGASRSVHSEGRAVDLAANAHDAMERDIADRYIGFLIAHATALQVQYLIWNGRSWKSGRGWQAYSGASAHKDHVHVELNRTGARSVTRAQLDTLWGEVDGTTPPTTEDDEVTPEDIDAIATQVAKKLDPKFMTAVAAVHDHTDKTAADTKAHVTATGGKIMKRIDEARDTIAALIRRLTHGNETKNAHDDDLAHGEAVRKSLGK